MFDRTSKVLLTVIALALVGLLVRPALIAQPAQAQTPTDHIPAPGQLVVSNGAIYTLVDGQLSVYRVSSSRSKQDEAKANIGDYKLELTATQRVADLYR